MHRLAWDSGRNRGDRMCGRGPARRHPKLRARCAHRRDDPAGDRVGHAPGEEVQPNGKLTISLGLATLPQDAVNKEDLIRRSDKALYAAKKSGRNRVVPYNANITED